MTFVSKRGNKCLNYNVNVEIIMTIHCEQFIRKIIVY